MSSPFKRRLCDDIRLRLAEHLGELGALVAHLDQAEDCNSVGRLEELSDAMFCADVAAARCMELSEALAEMAGIKPEPAWPDWHYIADGILPDDAVTCLIAMENPDSDEVILGHYDGTAWSEGVGDGVAGPKVVYAWAYAPAKPAKR
jgi:hypothetical protein